MYGTRYAYTIADAGNKLLFSIRLTMKLNFINIILLSLAEVFSAISRSFSAILAKRLNPWEGMNRQPLFNKQNLIEMARGRFFSCYLAAIDLFYIFFK